ncbi:MAG: 5-carboxymethyl-2-hydroxymuconate Delta-isomerase [Gammaproteobacteria bacterium]|nr:5-carboxymethyl-2-hydroxymuconate Delta-isomerase [Gammaproteobacteria bacterium]CAJ2376979.1 MAG: 5-carboxymethyl-2-hydroxymuconate delta-isomerase [Arenicellales bacterium IbO2]MDA7962171.1 5-carboxymethyl-2-hydroxymuconate Delta-isomerase [Gammaproteobacteria bacterium]MDA7970603.1 5-carboxymethyl-2-hydroxymuconate Delta-isomerase [Gammaproteobacteria bacterium]MDA7971818.1 5-carboxymethyl-2-hydroxymuconate Delta-isomerase [Gammaproteobacteria bacterium]
MPHLTIEYSANLESRLNVGGLLAAAHRAALGTGLFEVGGVRTRAVMRQHWVIADGHPDNAFVHAVIRIAGGRDEAAKKSAGEEIFTAMRDFLAPIFDAIPLAISFELQEIDGRFSHKQNNLHRIVAERGGGGNASRPAR